METTSIHIANTIRDLYGVEAEDGQEVFGLIEIAFKAKKSVTLSFENIELLTFAFLNTSIGQLYKDFSEEFIKQHLKVENISASGKVALKRVVETAKLFYKDPEALQHSIDEIVNVKLL